MNEVVKAALERTQQWAVEELEPARSRAVGLRVGGEAYNHAIEAIDQLNRIITNLGYVLTGLSEPVPTCNPPEIVDVPEHPAETESAAVFEEPAPEPKPTKAVDISKVRTKAKAARDAGVKLTEVWAKFGGTKLSDVPSEKYGELLDMLDELMQEND